MFRQSVFYPLDLGLACEMLQFIKEANHSHFYVGIICKMIKLSDWREMQTHLPVYLTYTFVFTLSTRNMFKCVDM